MCEKIRKVKEAEGNAEALLKMAKAEADAVRLINESQPSSAYVTLKGFEALEKVADGQATKLIIPSEIQNVAGLLASLKEVVTDSADTAKKKTK